MRQVLIVCMLFLYLTKSHGQDGIDGKYYRWDCEGSYDNWAGWDCSDDEQEHLYLYTDGTAEKYKVSNGSKSLVSTFTWRKGSHHYLSHLVIFLKNTLRFKHYFRLDLIS